MSDYSSSPYYSTALAAAAQYGIPSDLFIAQIGQESSFNPYAQNGNAYGIAQFMPGTAQQLGVNPSDPISSLYGAAAYDAQLYKQTGSWSGAMQSYGTTANGAGYQVAQIAQQQDLLNGSIFGKYGSGLGYLFSGMPGADTTGSAASSYVPGNASGVTKLLSILTDIPRMLTMIIGIILVIAGLFMLGVRPAVSIVESVKDTKDHIIGG